MRYLTEITKDNLSYCKELIEIVHELCHLDGIKGNHMESESEYIAPLIWYEYGKTDSQAIYSNIKEVAEQEQYVFDNLWNKAIWVKEVEEGRALHYETKVLTNKEEIVEKIKNFLETSNELLVRSGSGGLQLGYNSGDNKELCEYLMTYSQNAVAILMLDDEFDIMNMFTQALEQQGFPVIGFTEPLLALDHFLKNSCLYWLVVSDIRMPVMDGY